MRSDFCLVHYLTVLLLKASACFWLALSPGERSVVVTTSSLFLHPGQASSKHRAKATLSVPCHSMLPLQQQAHPIHLTVWLRGSQVASRVGQNTNSHTQRDPRA